MRRPQPAETSRLWSLLRRIDELAAWINPFLVMVAAMLAIAVMSVAAALFLSRLKIAHIGDPPRLASSATLSRVAVLRLPPS
jgi:hypothetical protein